MNQIVLKDSKNIVLTDVYQPDSNAAFGVIIPSIKTKHCIMADEYVSHFIKPANYSVVSFFAFTRKNVPFRRENITITEFIKWCLKSGMKVYQFSSPQEMLKWAAKE